MTIQVTDAMVSRFLAWRLPDDFRPDSYIGFDDQMAAKNGAWPTGTNLFYADQARAMLEHVLAEEPGQAIDLGEVTGTAPDLRPTAPVEAATLGESKAEQQTAHQLSDTSRTGTDAQHLRMTDHTIEAEIVAKCLTAPRVTKARIDELMARIVYTCDQRPNGSTTTLVHAFLDGDFYLATGVSACVSVANFDANIGRDIATANAESAAQDKLWELEGYALRERLASGGGL